jgi:pectate lyase
LRVPKTLWTAPSALVLALLPGTAWSQGAFFRDLGREVLAANDGWASSGAGVTGGSAAVARQVYVVSSRQELAAALSNGVYAPPSSSTPSNEPKIIYIDGTIDANVDDANRPLACADYNAPGFTWEAFLAQYDPATWGRTNPSGPLETARVASQVNQQNRVRLRVGSNTTIVGLRRNATLRGVWLDLRGTSAVPRTNIIIRNITFQDTYDCFPAWAPTDGSLGNWNSQYDSISLRDTTNVWIDHNTFEDVTTADATLPVYFGRIFQVHDGLVDITNASDLVTVSWNRFRNHDKNMLIGSSDSASADVGKLRVTIHHNLFEGVGQRAPRVRFGQVHVYNNLYRIVGLPTYGYSWGVGIQSAIAADNNYFETDEAVTPDMFIERFNGTAIRASGTLVNGRGPQNEVNVVAAWNEAEGNDPDLGWDVGWTPTLFTAMDPTRKVPTRVDRRAGPFAWRNPPPAAAAGRGADR